MAEYIVKPINDDDEEVINREWHPEELIRCKNCENRDSMNCWFYFFGRTNLPDDYYCADAK